KNLAISVAEKEETTKILQSELDVLNLTFKQSNQYYNPQLAGALENTLMLDNEHLRNEIAVLESRLLKKDQEIERLYSEFHFSSVFANSNERTEREMESMYFPNVDRLSNVKKSTSYPDEDSKPSIDFHDKMLKKTLSYPNGDLNGNFDS